MKEINTFIPLSIVGMFRVFCSQSIKLKGLSPKSKSGEKKIINLDFRRNTLKMLKTRISCLFIIDPLIFNEFQV